MQEETERNISRPLDSGRGLFALDDDIDFGIAADAARAVAIPAFTAETRRTCPYR